MEFSEKDTWIDIVISYRYLDHKETMKYFNILVEYCNLNIGELDKEWDWKSVHNMCWIFKIKDKDKAMLFKLTWK